MNKSPIISVIITTYNRADLLPRAINSVLGQTYRDFELIIVDDGSNDNTREIVKNFQENDPRIVYVYQENEGWPSALNKGLSIARGEFIAFLDSDDEWLPTKLKKQLDMFKKLSSIGMVVCWASKRFNDKGIKLFKTYKGLIEKGNFYEFFSSRGIISVSTIMVKKEVFEKVGHFDIQLKAAADLDFYIRVLSDYGISFLEEPLVNYYVTSESLSRKNFWIKWIPDFEYLMHKHLDKVNKYLPLKIYFIKTLAICYTLQNETQKANFYFRQLISYKPFNFKFYMLYFLFMINKKLFKALLFLKKSLFK